jgi:hypothetical protein
VEKDLWLCTGKRAKEVSKEMGRVSRTNSENSRECGDTRDTRSCAMEKVAKILVEMGIYILLPFAIIRVSWDLANSWIEELIK